MTAPQDAAVYHLRVQGVEQVRTYLTTTPPLFDEEYDIEAEHPADALDKLLHEIEWSILDSYSGFTISVAAGERPQ